MANPSQSADGEVMYSMERVAKNAQAITYVRTIMAIVTGLCAGTLGMKGLNGFAFYAFVYAATSVAVIVTKTGGSVEKVYSRGDALGRAGPQRNHGASALFVSFGRSRTPLFTFTELGII